MHSLMLLLIQSSLLQQRSVLLLVNSRIVTIDYITKMMYEQMNIYLIRHLQLTKCIYHK
jgi:hypothetical protein